MTLKTCVIGGRCAAAKRHLFLTTACCLICAVSVVQTSSSGPLPAAPSATAQSAPQAQTPSRGSNPLKGGADFVRLPSRKSVVFPDLATDRGALNSWEKFRLAANNSVSVSTIGAALLGAAYGQAINRPSGYGQGGSALRQALRVRDGPRCFRQYVWNFRDCIFVARRSPFLWEERPFLQAGLEIQRCPGCAHAK